MTMDYPETYLSFFFLIIQYSTKWLGNIRDRRAIYVGASDLGPAHASEAFSLVSRVTHILAKCLLHRPVFILKHSFSTKLFGKNMVLFIEIISQIQTPIRFHVILPTLPAQISQLALE